MIMTRSIHRDLQRLRALSLDRLVVAEAFVVIAVLALLMQAQADTWWHLAAGRDMLQAKHIALTDTWSHTVPALRWPNYEWLSEVLMFAAYQAGGLPGVTTCAAVLLFVC
jgi:hypothetical protein